MTTQTQTRRQEKAQVYDDFVARAQKIARSAYEAHRQGRIGVFDELVETIADLRLEYIASYNRLDSSQRADLAILLDTVKHSLSDYLDCFQVRTLRKIVAESQKEQSRGKPE